MKVIEAILFASEKHKGQVRRGSKLPYVTHPIIVSELLRKYKGDSKHITSLVCAAILHDVLEDTDATIQEIVEKFGDMTASLVIELTSNDELIEFYGKNEFLIQKMLKMTSYALVIKLCDRLSNILDGPKPAYLNDTKVMIDTLEAELDLTRTEKAIIIEIRKVLN